MSKKKLFIFILLVSFLIVSTKGNCDQGVSSKDISVYIFESNEQVRDAAVLNKQTPVMIIKKSNIKKVELTRYKEKLFKLKIDLIGNDGNELKKITSENIGKRIFFVKSSKILFAPFILAAVKIPIIVIELSVSEQDAKDIAGDFDRSFVFINKQPSVSAVIRKAEELINRREYDEALKIFKTTLNKTKSNDDKVFLYMGMFECYWLQKDYGNAAKAYQLLVKQPITIDLDNYFPITQAYQYLIGFENKHGNTKKAAYYAKKSNDISEYIINNYPLTPTARWANLGIGEFELRDGDVKDAEKRALLAIQADRKMLDYYLGYMLLAACYEYQDKYKDAEKIYEKIIKDFPNGNCPVAAQWYLDSLKHNKSEIKEEIKKYKRGVLSPD
ncbi:TPA: tetratricopeptide repeat protein [Candidatus Poribacteria bacterium]|nr:tetratricopeptide repeat protein [Candidatus Poribacteria bacterium]